MAHASRHPITPLAQLASEWKALGRSPAAIEAIRRVADRDATLTLLVLGTGTAMPVCPTPHELVAHLRRASGRRAREEAAAVIRALLREAAADPLLPRLLVQALLPGLIAVAKKLQWGRGGDWSDGDEFFCELLSTTWVTIEEWSGQDRPYAVLDLLSAIRCRLRRQLLKAKERRLSLEPLSGQLVDRSVRPETDLEELAHILIELHQQGMRPDEVEVLYAQHVLGYSISELAAVTGRNRRALYARRDRGRRRLCA